MHGREFSGDADQPNPPRAPPFRCGCLRLGRRNLVVRIGPHLGIRGYSALFAYVGKADFKTGRDGKSPHDGLAVYDLDKATGAFGHVKTIVGMRNPTYLNSASARSTR